MIWIAVGIGTLLVLVGCPILLKQWRVRKTYFPVTGTCVECDKCYGKILKKSSGIMSYSYAGRSYQQRLCVDANRELQAGEPYECCCDPEHPERIILKANQHEPLVLTVFCILALIAAVILVLLQEGII